MIDFLLTSTGDITFSESDNESNRLTINFYKSNAKTLKISFDIEGYGDLEPEKNTLKITFHVQNLKNNKRADLIKGDAYLMQQILMRLKTSLGELSMRQEIGSMIEAVMHKDIRDKVVHSKLEKIIADAIKDLLGDFAVKVVPKIDKSNGYDQCINAYIYKDDYLLLTYGLEW